MTGYIDAHHHLWDLSAVHYPWLMAQGVPRFFGDPTPIQRNYLLDEFSSDARRHGVGASVHIQVGAEDPLTEATWVDQVAQSNPEWSLVQVAFCDLTAPDRSDQLDRLSALPSVRGVRQIVGRAPGEDAQTGTGALIENPRFLEGLQEIGERGLSFDLQLLPEQMPAMARVLEQTPTTQIALCHAGSPHDRSREGLQQWQESLLQLSELPNVTCKLSGLGMFDHTWTPDRIAPIVQTCLDQFEPSRLMFGSNFPVDSLYSDYARLFTSLHGLIPKDARKDVFHETARGFYNMA